MNYCPKCGSFLPEGANACPNCGAPAFAEANTNVNTNANTSENFTGNPNGNPAGNNGGVYYNPQSFEQSGEYHSDYQAYNSAPDPNQSYFTASSAQQTNYGAPPQQDYYIQEHIKNELSSANTLGIIALVLGILVSWLVGVICGAIGLSKVNNLPDFPFGSPAAEEKAKTKKLNILGIVLPIVIRVILSIILYIFLIAVIGVSYDALGDLAGSYY